MRKQKSPVIILQKLRDKFSTKQIISSKEKACGYWLLNSIIDHLLEINAPVSSDVWKRLYDEIRSRPSMSDYQVDDFFFTGRLNAIRLMWDGRRGPSLPSINAIQNANGFQHWWNAKKYVIGEHACIEDMIKEGE